MTNFNLTNAEMINLIAEYQTTQDDAVFSEIYAKVQPMTKKIAISFYNSKRHAFDYIPADDYINMAEFAIYKAVQKYDVTIGSPFNSFLKQLIQWTLNDELIKKNCTKDAMFNTLATKHSLDKPVDSESHSTYGDVVGHYHATDVDAVFNEAFEMAEETASSNMVTEMKEMIQDFHDEASEDDSAIIKIVVATVISVEGATAKVVNKALAEANPLVKSATLRKRKSRAITRFTEFAKDNGFVALDLSQF